MRIVYCFVISSLLTGSFSSFVRSPGQGSNSNEGHVSFKIDGIENGKVEVDYIQYSARCNKGYELVGEHRFKCFLNGSCIYPNNVAPICRKVTCESPDNLLSGGNGHVISANKTQFEYLDQIKIECDEWYEMQGGASAWMCDHNGNWVNTSNPVSSNPPNDIPFCRPKCGIRLVREDAFGVRMAGAKRVNQAGSWPWMAFIDLGQGRNGSLYCGGTLIDENTVVTAASCLSDVEDDEDIRVWLGILDRTRDNFNYTQSFVVTYARRFIERSFLPGPYDFDGDIAVLKLDRAASLSYYVHPICLPSAHIQDDIIRRYMLNRLKAVAIGWGQISPRRLSENLMRIKVELLERESCKKKFEELPVESNIVTDNMICSRTGRKSTCDGDGGGPLMTQQDDKWYLSGITSFGGPERCGETTYPDVYTDVSKYLEFLEFHMKS